MFVCVCIYVYNNLLPAGCYILYKTVPNIWRWYTFVLRNVSFLFNLLKPTGYVMHQQFNIQQLYVLPTLYLCVLYLSENKQRLAPITS